MADVNEVDEFTGIDPYECLGITKDASEADVRKAYRRLALIHHPDKSLPENREAAHTRFQEIAFAYGVLSEPERRRLYDETGSLEESASDFSWKEFFDQMYKRAITKEIIEEDKREYRESGQEREDILKFYATSRGSLDVIFENVVHSDVLEDEERFRGIIDEAIDAGEVKAYKKYTGEAKAERVKRRRVAQKESAEAEEMAKKLKVDKVIGSEAELGALIRKRQAARMGNFLEDLEKKYSSGNPSSKKSKTTKSKSKAGSSSMPTEEEFAKLQNKLLNKK
ncbi:uncharacterized protein V1510DRAFT_110035 [Dipodascopsis tothii]|uniref:uncharacterized protein n=1 Tax=Dipodascopsis tothii TaxID=44089 RepID=UPI0034CE30C8